MWKKVIIIEVLMILVILITILILLLIYNRETTYSILNNKSNKFIIMFVLFGVIALIASIVFPIVIHKRYSEVYTASESKLNDLSNIGDFLGGTTVGLLTAASVILLLATILMQRKEIKISQQGIDELVKQTAASIEQAKIAQIEARKTNETMQRQQFESTFFNMVNLHQTILANLKLNTEVKDNVRFSKPINAEGRELISELKDEFEYLARKEYRRYKFTEYFSDGEVSEIFNETYDEYERNLLLKQVIEMRHDGGSVLSESEIFELEKKINEEQDINSEYPELISIKEKHPFIISQIYKSDYNYEIRHWLSNLDGGFYRAKHHPSTSDEYIIENSEGWEKAKIICYEKFYRKLEYIFGHYYRNLYRIVKFINETEMIDELAKKDFRGILRAQLSSDELMMLFYNVIYSEKGERFKNQLQGKKFLDDHLIIEDFVWNDDRYHLEKLN